jgi:hypothetical protein
LSLPDARSGFITPPPPLHSPAFAPKPPSPNFPPRFASFDPPLDALRCLRLRYGQPEAAELLLAAAWGCALTSPPPAAPDATAESLFQSPSHLVASGQLVAKSLYYPKPLTFNGGRFTQSNLRASSCR